jgi:hypothetical protein
MRNEMRSSRLHHSHCRASATAVPLPLLRRLERRAVHLLLQSRELVDDDTDEEVDGEERADDEEGVEVQRDGRVVLGHCDKHIAACEDNNMAAHFVTPTTGGGSQFPKDYDRRCLTSNTAFGFRP